MARTITHKQAMFSTAGGRVRRGSSRRVQTVGRAPRRPRGPAPIVIIVALIALVVACWVFGRGCGTSQQAVENDRLKTYTLDTNKLVEQSANTAQSFSNLANGVGSIPKNDANRQLTEIVNECKSLEQGAVQVKVPAKGTSVQPLLKFSLNRRSKGATEYQKGITTLLTGTDTAAAAQSIQAGLRDLVVSDETLLAFKSSLETKLRAAKADTPVADPGRFVASLDSASTASINAYVASIAKKLPATAASTSTTAAANPSQAMTAYLKSKGTDNSSMTYEVVSSSSSDPGWKIDAASESGGGKTYFLLHQVNGSWTVVDSGSAITAAQLKAGAAPTDLKPVG